MTGARSSPQKRAQSDVLCRPLPCLRVAVHAISNSYALIVIHSQPWAHINSREELENGKGR